MSSLSFVRIQNDVLIPLVEKRPVLWDSAIEMPKRKKAKRRAWKDLCKEMHEDFDKLDDDEQEEYVNGVKQRWQCLHDTFFKKKSNNSSGDKKYIYAEKMQFLEKLPNTMGSCVSMSSNRRSDSEAMLLAPLSKYAADIAFQKENFENLRISESNRTNHKKLTNVSLKNSPNGDSHEPTDETCGEDRFSKCFIKNGFCNESPKYKSTPKHQVKGFYDEVSEKKYLKTKKKSEMVSDRTFDRYNSYIDKSSKDVITEMPKGLEGNGHADEDTSTPEPRSTKVGTNLNRQDNGLEETVYGRNKSENPDLHEIADKTFESSFDKSLKDAIVQNVQRKEPSQKLSKKQQGKDKSVNQLPIKKTSKRRHDKKYALPENSKKFCGSKSADKLSTNVLVKNLPQDNFIGGSCVDKLTDQNEFTKSWTDQLSGDQLVEKLTCELSQNVLANKASSDNLSDKLPTEKLSFGLSHNGIDNIPFSGELPIEELSPSPIEIDNNQSRSEDPPTLQREEVPIFDTSVTEQTWDESVAGLKPELSSTFNLFIQSVMPHLKKLDQSEILEFQMGVLQIIGQISERKNAAPISFPHQLLDTQTPYIGESQL